MADLKCPTGMVLISPKGAVYPDEPAFCINKTEVTQEEDDRYWNAHSEKIFVLTIRYVDGSVITIVNSQKTALQNELNEQMKLSKKHIVSAEIKSEIDKPKPQPDGKYAGPRKPSTRRTWKEAREYCQGAYHGGDLPTDHQWDNACGHIPSSEKLYCTASGGISAKEAVIGANLTGPADVGSTLPNPRGVQDMTGNVWEWLRGDPKDFYRRARGGAWYPVPWFKLMLPYPNLDSRGPLASPSVLPLRRDYYNYDGDSNIDIGFRCVAPPLSPATQPAKAKVAAPRNVVKKK